MNWAITGGSGQLGRSLTQLLDNEGFTYTSWDHKSLDVSSPDSIEIISQTKPDLLINCAAWTNVDGAESNEDAAKQVNAHGALNMALAAKILDIPIVHISTDYVFSGNNTKPWKVDDQTGPISQYGISKLLGEVNIQNTWQKSYILRTAWLYGPFGKNFAKTILKKAISTKDEIRVVNDQKGQPSTTFDLARQIVDLIQNSSPFGIYHATNSGEATWWEFAREIVKLSGENENRVIPVLTSEFQTSAKRPAYSVLDHSEWQNAGMKPMRDWRVALHEVFPQLHESVIKEIANAQTHST